MAATVLQKAVAFLSFFFVARWSGPATTGSYFYAVAITSVGGYPIGSTYDVRIVLFDKDMLTVKDEYLLNPNSPYFFLDFYGDSWRPKDFYKNIKNMYPNAVLPDFTIPVVFSPVFKNNETCVTVKAR
jgi:hypothetical protein